MIKTIFFTFVLSLAGCATGEKMSSIVLGMSPLQVESVLGRPDGVKKETESMWYRYNHRLTSGWSWDRADYHVIFKNDQVVEYGQGEVRLKDNSIFIIIK